MTVTLSFIGLLIGVSAFLYFLNIYEGSKKKIKAMTSNNPKTKPDSSNDIELERKKVMENLYLPGERICPLCRSKLTKSDALYASRVRSSNGEKILIHGCRHCYKDS